MVVTEIYEGRIKFTHDCWTPYASKKFPQVKMLLPEVVHSWDGYLTSVCYVNAPTKRDLNRFIATCEKHKSVKSVKSMPLNKDWTKLYVISKNKESNYDKLEHRGCFDKQWTAAAGFEESTIITKNKEEFRKAVDALKKDGEVKVLKQGKRKINVDIVDYLHAQDLTFMEFLLDITPKQRLAMELAIDKGYYEPHRRISLKDLAEEMGTSVVTFREHLKKAENKLMKRIREFLKSPEKMLH